MAASHRDDPRKQETARRCLLGTAGPLRRATGLSWALSPMVEIDKLSGSFRWVSA